MNTKNILFMLLLALTAVRNNMIEWRNIKRITYLLTVMTKKAYLYWHAWMNEWKPVWLVLPNYNIATAICGCCLATLLLWLRLLLLPIDDDDDDNFLFLLLWITCNEEEIKHSSIFLSFILPHYQLSDRRAIAAHNTKQQTDQHSNAARTTVATTRNRSINIT